jgi:hypothetical protein
MNSKLKIIRSIQNRIYELRNGRIMLDTDLAMLYEVETRVLNQAVKRNRKRFPKDFMFQLRPFEYEFIRKQIEMLREGPSSQIVMIENLPHNRSDKYLPYAFTEQGIAMLSGVLNSERAIQMNISIMRAFVEIRKIGLTKKDIKKKFAEIQKQIGNHAVKISQIYDAIENLMDEKAAEKQWQERERIGFRKGKS